MLSEKFVFEGKMKKVDFLKEYVTRLPDDAVKYIGVRLDEKIGSDLAEALDELANAPDINGWLMSAENFDTFYDMVDLLNEYFQKEMKKRNLYD